ncbi:MAG TPA: discoidin domain-containing protein [Cyclobacteriaceae bacterium]|nr:discoidin domain-containing protein [Cyclobacteriaceae bacterium]
MKLIRLLPILLFFLLGCNREDKYPILDHAALATKYYGADASWYLDNIPFFECSDQEIEQVYYYRWKLYKAHIRNVGQNEFVITEFITHMDWDRAPYCTINAASMHHIYEGRWLTNNIYVDGYINNLYQHGGNNLQYSESIADASYARYLVNANSVFIIGQLDSMIHKYNGWSDHWDADKKLYYIPAMPDATEYTIASIDASGGKDGFAGGEAFRPTINSYMFGNALAISRIAAMKGDIGVSNDFLQRANALKANVEQSLWNDSMEHFIDRYKVDNEYVHYWDFIRGRELAGFAPWYFNLPTNSPKYNVAWKHLLDTTQLRGKYGLRTNEPSYEYYFKQYTFNDGKPGSQWNGPTWPYQSSQAITAMANLLNNYDQDVVTASDYVSTLRQFTKEHYLPDGKINLVENYDPNKGGPIVYFYWSNHYLHSSFNNLIISGLCGIRPSEGDTLTINPLIDNSITYFRLDEVLYHGHKVTVIYDKDGSKYNAGKGVTVYVDGVKKSLLQKDGKYQVVVGPPLLRSKSKQPVNYALNIRRKDFPVPSASVNSVPDSLYQALDGRIWYFPEIRNRWATVGSTSKTDWYALDFGQPRDISSLKYYLFTDDKNFGIPDNLTIEYQNEGEWLPVKVDESSSGNPVGNTVNTVAFEKVSASRIRVTFKHETKQLAISEIEYY